MARFVFARFLRRISSADPRVHFGVLWGCVDEDGSGGLRSRGAEGAGSSENEGGNGSKFGRASGAVGGDIGDEGRVIGSKG